MDFASIPDSVLEDALQQLTTFFLKKVRLQDFKGLLTENGLYDCEKVEKNLSNEDWVLHTLSSVRKCGPGAIPKFFDMFRENDENDWILEKIEETLRNMQHFEKSGKLS